MGIVTTHTCDRCGHTQDQFGIVDKNGWRKMRTIRLIAYHNPVGDNMAYYRPPNYEDSQHQVLWCEACCVEVGIVRVVKRGAQPPSLPETPLEDMLREIIREEISNAQP